MSTETNSYIISYLLLFTNRERDYAQKETIKLYMMLLSNKPKTITKVNKPMPEESVRMFVLNYTPMKKLGEMEIQELM